MTNKFVQTVLLGSVFTSAIAVVPASAQNDGSAARIVDQIVVTARYREERLEDVPLSITAFSAQDVLDAQIDRPDDFIGLTPNVTFVDSQNAGTSFITIRGISQVRNGEPPIATLVDGVLQVSPNQFTQELFDIESIQIVRGPQGALYGRNATGGAIIITTKQPTNDFNGTFRAGYGKGDEFLVQGSVMGPIVEDKLFFRAGVRYLDRGGYYTNITLNEKVDYIEDLSFRGMLKWHVADNLSADFRANISRVDAGAANFTYQPTIFGADGRTLSTTAPGNFPFDFSTLDANDTSIPFTANNLGYNERNIDELALKVTYDLPLATVTATSSWNRVSEFFSQDQFPYTASTSVSIPGFGSIDGTATQFLDVESFSQELRFTSPSDQRLRWMLGGYFLKTDRFISTVTGLDLGQGVLRVEREPFPSDPGNPTTQFFADDNDNKAWAVFGQLAYDVTDTLEIAVAARYDKDIRVQNVSPFLFGGLGMAGARNNAEFDKLQPKVSISYQPTDNLNLYASWGEGFRSGQFNQNGVSEGAANFGLIGLSDIAGQEETESFEAGFKSAFFDDLVKLNAATFYTKVTGQQYFVFVGALNAQVLENIDKVELIGGEIELFANPMDGLDFYVSAGLTDSNIEEYARVPSNVGNWAPYVARITFNAGAQYRTPLTNSLGLFMRADYEHRGKQFWDPENSTARDALDLLALRLGVEANDGAWSIVGSMNNALDERYNSDWVGGGFAHLGLPRTWNIDFSYRF